MTAPLPAPHVSFLSRGRLLFCTLLACLGSAMSLYAQGAAALSITTYPATLPEGGGTYNVTVSYTATEAGRLEVFLLDASYGWRGEGILNVTAGSGTATIPVAVGVALTAGPNYGFYAKLKNGSGTVVKEDSRTVQVSAGASALSITASPATLPEGGGTYNVTVSYTATEAGRLEVFLLDASYGWRGEGSLNVTAGSGTVTIPVTVGVPLTAGSNYGFYAKLKNGSGTVVKEDSRPVTVATAPDALSITAYPATLPEGGGTHNVTVSYTATEAGSLQVFLLDAAYGWRGEGTLNVAAGSGTATVAVTVGVALTAGPNYGFYAKLKNGSGAVVKEDSRTVQVVPPSSIPDPKVLAITSSPDKIRSGADGTYELAVRYAAAEAGRLEVFLLDAAYGWRGEGVVDVTPGTHTVLVPVTVGAALTNGTGYTFNAKLKNGSNAVVKEAAAAVEVVDAAALTNTMRLTIWPDTLAAPATGGIPLRVAYRAGQAGRVKVTLEDEAFDVKGTVEGVIPGGTGGYETSLSLTMPLPTGLVPNSTYTFFAKVLDGGGAQQAVQGKPVVITGAAPAGPRTFYVKPDGDNARDGLSVANAFGSVQYAASQTFPGDTVYVLGGTYVSPSIWTATLNITRPGTAGQPIVYKNYPGHAPKIKNGGYYGTVDIRAPHIVFDGFAVEGNNDSYTLAQATAIYNAFKANGYSSFDNRLFSVGIGLKAHQVVRNCKVYKFGGGGIAGGEDYLTIEGNLVYECGLYGPFGMSGISIYNPINTDGVTAGYKIKIVNNVSHSNYNYFPCECFPGKVTDGNGIILDDFKNSQRAAGDPLKDVVYTGRTLVANNIVYNNGGSGIHTFKGANTDIVNKTAYRNGRHPDLDGEIFANNSEGITITNNILYGRAGEAVSHDFGNNTNVVMDYNLYYDGTPAPDLDGVAVAANSRVADPLFFRTPDPAVATPADFTLQPASPAVNAGTDAKAPAADFAGTPRPAEGRYDIGAYEWVAPPLRTPENPSGATAGVNYAYYRGTWTALPDFSTLKPTKTGTLNNFLLVAPKQDRKFAFRYTGYVQVPADGVYTFYTTSSDGSKLYVGATPVVQNDGLHGVQERSGAIALKAGKHALTVEYFQNEGSKSLAVAYSGPGVARQPIPDAALFRTAPGGKKGARDGLVEEAGPAAGLRVFPVPARDYLRVAFSSTTAGQVTAELTDALGRPVGGSTHPAVVGANTLTLPVGHLKRGFYLLSLTGGTQRQAAKVVLSE